MPDHEMPDIRVPMTRKTSLALLRLKNETGKSIRALMREAATDLIKKYQAEKRGLTCEWIRTDELQKKIDLE